MNDLSLRYLIHDLRKGVHADNLRERLADAGEALGRLDGYLEQAEGMLDALIAKQSGSKGTPCVQGYGPDKCKGYDHCGRCQAENT